MSLNADALQYLLSKGFTAEEMVEFARVSERRSDHTAAERQRRCRANKRHAVTVTRDGSPYEDTSTPSGSPSEPTVPSVKRGAKPDPFPCPDFADPKHWRDLLLNRKRKRLPNTETAYANMMADIRRIADNEWPPGRLVQHAAAKGWGGIYDPRESENRNGHQPKQGLRGSRPDPAVDLLRQARADAIAEGTDEDQDADSGTRPALPSYLTG